MPRYLGDPKVQYFKTGTVDYLNGGKAYFYEPNSLTLKNTYPTIADAIAETNANTNPVILDSRGEASIVINGNTKMILKDSAGNTIWTEDNIDQGGTDIVDSNGNDFLKFVSIPNAVNEWTITNAATTQAPRFDATGGDTNVAGQISSKGSGTLYLDAGATGTVDVGTTSTGAINLKRNTAITGTLTVSGAGTISGGISTTSITASGDAIISGNISMANITASGSATLASLLTANGGITVPSGQATNFIPAGTVAWKASTNVPTGWLECNGAAVNRTTYPALFTDIGTTYGSGDGSTTFNLPTSARRTLVGKGGTGTATLSNTVGSTGGAETHTLTVTEMPSHTHTYQTNPLANIFSVGGATGTNSTSSGSSGSTGGDGAHNNIQPSLVMMMIIRAF